MDSEKYPLSFKLSLCFLQLLKAPIESIYSLLILRCYVCTASLSSRAYFPYGERFVGCIHGVGENNAPTLAFAILYGFLGRFRIWDALAFLEASNTVAFSCQPQKHVQGCRSPRAGSQFTQLGFFALASRA